MFYNVNIRPHRSYVLAYGLFGERDIEVVNLVVLGEKIMNNLFSSTYLLITKPRVSYFNAKGFLRKKVVVSLLSALFALCLSNSYADTLFQGLVPLSETIAIPCESDSVTLNGSLYLTLKQDTDAKGNVKQFFHFVPRNVTGVSTKGIEYHGAGQTVGFITQNSDGSFQANEQNMTLIIGQGPNNDFRSIAHIVIKVDSNGKPIVFIDNEGDFCGIGG
jgi:hypothetical protein